MPLPFERFFARPAHALSVILLSLALSLGAATARTEIDADIGAVLERERAELAQTCGPLLEFLDGFATSVDVDGNALPDILVDYGRLSCDGSRMMFCGSAGCTQKIYLGRSGGAPEMVGEFLAYELRFDRPSQGSFLAVLHGGSCGRAGAETCFRRYALSGGAVVALEEEPRDRWFFTASPSPSAMLATPDGDSLRLVCDGGALRIEYGPTWLWEDGGSVSEHARDLAKPQGRIEIDIEVDRGQPTPVAFMIEETARVLQSPTFAPDEPLFAAMMRGSGMDLHLGGSLEHLRNVTLKGSSRAIGSLLRACGQG